MHSDTDTVPGKTIEIGAVEISDTHYNGEEGVRRPGWYAQTRELLDGGMWGPWYVHADTGPAASEQAAVARYRSSR